MPPAEPAEALSLAELAHWTARFADEVRQGLHEVRADPAERWHVRLHEDDDVDVWLISWTTEQGTELHDHGGSSGAFTVVEGTLTETTWSGGLQQTPGRLVDHERGGGDTVAFGPHYVHDVRNHGEEVAVSVHAYSPPLRLMNYYDATATGLLRWASSWTDDPEAPSPERPSERRAS